MPGAEYKIGEYMIDLIRQGNIASFHGGKVLVEHSFVAPSPVFEEVIFRLQDKGYTPCWHTRSVTRFMRNI